MEEFIDLIPVNDIQLQKPLYSRDELLYYFYELLNWDYETFFSKYPHLDDNQKAILLFLSHIYNDSLKTIKVYLNVLCEMFNYIRKYFYDITHDDLNNFKTYLKNNNLKSNTLSLKFAIIKSFFTYICSTGKTNHNPAILIKKPTEKPSKHTQKILTYPQLQEFFRYCKKHLTARDYLIIMFIFFTGMRRNEVINLTWKDIFEDIQGRAWVRVLGKGGKEREVYLPNKLLNNLLKYRNNIFVLENFNLEMPDILLNKPIFPCKHNINQALTTSSIYKIVNKAGQNALNKSISPHWLRHCYATYSRMNGASLESINQQLGHENYNTTMKYEHSAHLLDPAGRYLNDTFGDL